MTFSISMILALSLCLIIITILSIAMLLTLVDIDETREKFDLMREELDEMESLKNEWK